MSNLEFHEVAFVAPPPLTLTEFLLARIAEDEWWAREASRRDTTYIARVLAECAAKRKIVEASADYASIDAIDGGVGFDTVLRLLALPYADHPDYREEWRP